VTAIGPWTLVVEPNGFLGVSEEVVVPRSRGTRLVSHFRNVNYELHTEAAFALAEHITQVRLTAEFLESATFRCGTAPFPGT
jgi:hypothetical protein